MGPHRRYKNSRSPLDSTRIHSAEVTGGSFPKRAVGVEVICIGEERLGERIWIGGPVCGVEVTRHLRFFALDDPEFRPAIFAALRALDGSRSISELSAALALPLAQLTRLLLHLEGEGLIHFHCERSPESETGGENWTENSKRLIRSNTNFGQRSELSRRDIEREHLPRGSSFRHRSRVTIAIVSDQGHSITPTATSLAALLYGSGFERITFITQQHPRQGSASRERISDRDLGLSIFNGSDIGSEKLEKVREIAHRSAILPLDDSNSIPINSDDFEASLTISLGYPRPDHHQRWLSEDRPFLIVPGYEQREIRIGPILIPGKTPCLRCYELNQVENDFWREQSRQLQQLTPSIDPPTVASHLIASLTAHYVTLWLDGDDRELFEHPLVGHQYIFDLDHRRSKAATGEGLSPVRMTRWHSHPECGCLWIPTSKLNARA